MLHILEGIICKLYTRICVIAIKDNKNDYLEHDNNQKNYSKIIAFQEYL